MVSHLYDQLSFIRPIYKVRKFQVRINKPLFKCNDFCLTFSSVSTQSQNIYDENQIGAMIFVILVSNSIFRTILAESNCSVAQYWFNVSDILHCTVGG